MSTSEKVHFGLKWVGVSTAVSQGIRLLATAVLARILVPEMFGLVALAQVTMGILGVIRDVGIRPAYIQRPDRGPADTSLAADTAFFITLGFNTLLFALAFAFAPTVAEFFESAPTDLLASVLRAMFLTFLIDGLMATPNMILQKRLDFGRHALGPIVAAVVQAAISIPLALNGHGVWSLVVGFLVSQCAWAALAFRLAGWRPRWRFSRAIAGELVGYGKWMWAFGALSAVGDSLDRVVIGRWLGASEVGIYGLAQTLSALPATHIGRLAGRILFPSFAQMQADPAQLKAAFLKALSHVSIVTLPVAFGMLAVNEDLILTIYGDQWIGAAPVVGVLAFYGMSLSVSSLTGSIFQAIGKPRVLLYTSLVHQSLQLGLLLTLGRHGMVAVAWCMVIPILLSSLIAFVLVSVNLALGPWRVAEILLRAAIPALGMFLAVRALDSRLDAAFAPAPFLSLAIGVACGGAIYLALSALTNRRTLVEFIQTVREVLVSKGELV